jgi:Tfp pilus assembly protein PilF/2-polyprenyl-3-methyl-5-hydroxy-6-metoxy-1,4-benzoquinol methylase
MRLEAQATLVRAVGAHQAGRLAEAEGLYRDILAANPKHAQSLYLLGVIALQRGQPAAAVELIGRAIAHNRRIPEFHNHLGEAVRALGRLDEAVEHYERAIKLKPGFADAHNNLGLALITQGRLDQAAARFARALIFDSANADTHNNLGNALMSLGRPDEAAAQFEKALTLRPDYANAHNNLGVVLMQQGKLAEAAERFHRTLALKPNHGGAHSNLATVALARGNPAEGLEAVTRALQCDETAEARTLFFQCIKELQPKRPRDDIRALLARALSEPWGRPSELARVGAAFVALDAAVAAGIAQAAAAWPRRLSLPEVPTLAAICEDRLLRCLMEATAVCDVALERLLSSLRSVILDLATGSVASGVAEHAILGFACASARQCFINEYVFSYDEKEFARAQTLRAQLEQALRAGAAVPALWPAAVAAYFPLHTLAEADALRARSWPDPLAAVLAQQISEPREEEQDRRAIPRLTAIDNTVSLLVQQQYEENPYPRWEKAAPATPATFDRFLRGRFPQGRFRPLDKVSAVDILIAGCGTGQHSTATAQQIAGARVLAVDLSLASLGYARRKTRELGLGNIEYAQADILRLESIGRSFDVIEAGGVLHHLADPTEGWRILLTLLRPGGFMRLGLYSETARADIVAARALIAAAGYGAHDIRRCRQDLMGRDDDALKKVVMRSDFFNTGACRDLLFHVQEHRLTLPAIDAFLRRHGLHFIGFDLDARIVARFRARFPDDEAMTDLERWHAFETEHPTTFAAMYQFWIQKP